MRHFCITYELGQGGKDHYHAFFAALEVFADRCHAFNGVLFVSTDWTAERVHAYLGRHLDPTDLLSVNEMAAGVGWSGWVRQDVREWLTKHLGPAA